LPYANGSIHIGHLVEYIETDIFVRFLRLVEEDVVYCCADDTHGAPIAIKAEQLKIKPEELIAKYNKEHLQDFKDFLIKFDSYYTTNSKENKYFSDLIFERAKKKGFIYTKEVEVTYCEHCKRNLPDRYVKGKCPKCGAEDQYGDVCEKCNAAYATVDLVDPYCTICHNTPIRKLSNHYFFKLSTFSGILEKWLNENKNLQPEIVNFILNWIKEGLRDWDISRDGPYFGFNIPGEKDKYYYVWLDAPIGYISSFSNTLGLDVKKAEKEWNKSKIIHFIGKDIIYFHYLFWPAMLTAADLQLPEYIVTHGFLTVQGQKMSKSRGTFMTARQFLNRYKPEYLRYYYAKVLSKKMSDINLDFDDFRDSINNELVANIGNFCYRTISFTNKFFNGQIKEIDDDESIINEISERVEQIKKSYVDVNTLEAVKNILAISSLGNKYFQEKEPWKLINEDKEKAQQVLGLCLNIAKNLAIVAAPILPGVSHELQKQLGLKDLKWNDINFNFKNKKIKKEKILVEKLKEAKKEIFPLDLRVAEVVEIREHPEADKLFILKVNLGSEQRQIVAGLREHYQKEELLNKKIVVVCNLKPAKLKGKLSQGMLLAGEKDNQVGILYADKSDSGDAVTIEDADLDKNQINIEQFSKLCIKVKEGKVLFNDKVLKTEKEEIKVEKVSEGAVH